MRIVFPLAALLCGSALPALSATYTLQPFSFPHATSVSVAGINDHGLATGTYVSAAQPYGAGFVGRRGTATTLEPLEPSGTSRNFIPIPTGIDNRGTVIGTYFLAEQVDDFAWRHGVYVATFSQSVDSQNVFPPFIGTGDHISYNTYSGDGVFMAYAGPLSAQSALPRNGNPLVASVNVDDQAAGQFFTFIGTIMTSGVFLSAPVDRSSPRALLPPGATAAFGGWINDAGQVAGSYQDSKNILRGFLYQKGSYSTYDLPAHPDALTTQAIDGTGRVVGTYTEGKTQFAFIYAVGAVTKLRSFPAADTVHAGISPAGTYVVISDTNPNGVAHSWLVTCNAGTGC